MENTIDKQEQFLYLLDDLLGNHARSVVIDNEHWLYMSYDDIGNYLEMNPSTAYTMIKRLRERKLVLCKRLINPDHGKSTVNYYRLP